MINLQTLPTRCSKIEIFAFLVFSMFAISIIAPLAAQAGLTTSSNTISGSINDDIQQYIYLYPNMSWLAPKSMGGFDQRDPNTNQELMLNFNPATDVPGANPIWTIYGPGTPVLSSQINMRMPAVDRGMAISMLGQTKWFGRARSDAQEHMIAMQAASMAARMTQYPPYVAEKAKAEQNAQMTQAGNSMGDMTKDQASAAVDYCSKYMTNFTVDGANKWNQLRNQLFIPMAILLLLPGAILTQIRAIISAGSPVLTGESMANPFDGILRSIIAVFLIPATYLVVNYGIDLSNSITFTLSDSYQRLFGSSMYKDAVCAQIRAFPSRTATENAGAANAVKAQSWPETAPTDQPTLEKDLFESKIDDPCTGEYSAPPNRADEAMPGSAVFARALSFGTNAALTAAWNVLCAFQMVYLVYLFLIGPVIAALWAWPMRQLQEALPAWIEGCITICFWSLFWNTVILLMACFKGVGGETGTIMISALNFLATAAVKHAFDFVSLIREAGQNAGQQAMKGQKGGQKGGQGGNGTKGQKGQGQRPRSHGPEAHPGAHGPGAGPHPGEPGSGRPGEHPATAHGTAGVMAGATGSVALGPVAAADGQHLVAGGALMPHAKPHATGAVSPRVAPPPTAAAHTAGQRWQTSHILKGTDGKEYTISSTHTANGGETISVTGAGLDGKPIMLNAGQLAKGETGLPLGNGGFLTVNGYGNAENYSLNVGGKEVGQLSVSNRLINASSGGPGILGNVDGGQLVRLSNGELALRTPDGQLHNFVAGENGQSQLKLGDTTYDLTTSGGANNPFVELTATNTLGSQVCAYIFDNSVNAGIVSPHSAVATAQGALSTLAHLEGAGSYTLYGSNGQVISDLAHVGAGEIAIARDAHGHEIATFNGSTGVLKATSANGEAIAQLNSATNQWSALAADGTLTGMQAQFDQHTGQWEVLDNHGRAVAQLNDNNTWNVMANGVPTATEAVFAKGINGQQELTALADGRAIAQYDQGTGWQAVAPNDYINSLSLSVDQNNGFTISGSMSDISLTPDLNGNFTVAGTSYALNANTNTIAVNGACLPVGAISGDMLREANMHMPAAEATITELSQPGIAQAVAAHNLPEAQTAFDAAQIGLEAQTLARAGGGDWSSEVRAMAQEAAVDPAYCDQVASQLGVSPSLVWHHLDVAQAMLDRAHLGVQAEILAQAVSGSGADELRVMSQAAASAGYGNQISPQLDASQDVLMRAARDPAAFQHVSAAETQFIAEEAFFNSNTTSAPANPGLPSETITQAAHGVQSAETAVVNALSAERYAMASSDVGANQSVFPGSDLVVDPSAFTQWTQSQNGEIAAMNFPQHALPGVTSETMAGSAPVTQWFQETTAPQSPVQMERSIDGYGLGSSILSANPSEMTTVWSNQAPPYEQSISTGYTQNYEPTPITPSPTHESTETTHALAYHDNSVYQAGDDHSVTHNAPVQQNVDVQPGSAGLSSPVLSSETLTPGDGLEFLQPISPDAPVSNNCPINVNLPQTIQPEAPTEFNSTLVAQANNSVWQPEPVLASEASNFLNTLSGYAGMQPVIIPVLPHRPNETQAIDPDEPQNTSHQTQHHAHPPQAPAAPIAASSALNRVLRGAIPHPPLQQTASSDAGSAMATPPPTAEEKRENKIGSLQHAMANLQKGGRKGRLTAEELAQMKADLDRMLS